MTDRRGNPHTINHIADTFIGTGAFRGVVALDRNKGRVMPPRPPIATRKQREDRDNIVQRKIPPWL